MNEAALLDLLRKKVETLGSQQAVACEMDISPQYLHDVLKGRRKIGNRILTALGMERRVEYIRAGKQ